MKKAFSPIFIIPFVILPQLLALGYLLRTSDLSNTKMLMFPVVAVLLSGAFFAVYAYMKHKEAVIHTKVFIAISAAYTVLTVWGVLFDPVPSNPDGLVSPKLVFIAACMLSVLYGILGAAYNTASPGKASSIGKFVAGTLLAPFIWFLAINLVNGMNSNAVAMFLIIAAANALIFLAARILFTWLPNKPPLAFDVLPSKKYYLAVFIIALCMPLAGLVLNQSFADFGGDGPSAGMFGDFSHPLFYMLAALNGLLLLVPPLKNKGQRLFLFYLKSAGYAYILYFFAVFLPSLPLGIFGIIFFGLGILVYTPLMVTLLQGYHLIKEWVILSKTWRKWQLAAVFCIGLATLPLCMTASFWGDKENFSVAVQYLEPKNFDNTAQVNLTRLKRTLKNIKGNLIVTRGELGFSQGNTPLLSEFYTGFVLDGKIISQDNVLALESLFFDAGHDADEASISDPDIVTDSARLVDAVGKTRFDDKAGVYRSWVDLKLENANMDNGEYVTAFKLPEGAYISDYYLDVGGKRKEGLLTDRRAALFIYRKIVNTRRDPGLLHYISPNTLELRVFPFAPNEKRETGFEIIHSQKLNLALDNRIIPLGGDAVQKEVRVDGAVLLPAAQKANLKPVVRKPKYYFVVDSSKNSNVPWHVSQIREYVKANNITDADVIFASYKLQKHTLSDITEARYAAECGFNLNLAANMILSKEDACMFPIIIAVSDNMPGAVFPRSIHPLSGKFPESPCYYALNHNLTLTPYAYADNKAGNTVDEPITVPILDYNGIYVSDNDENELVLTGTPSGQSALTGSRYENAVLLDAMHQQEVLSGKTDSVELVRASFRARILTPQTAFIVVETKQQEKELLDLQERILNNNEEAPTVRLDEPSIVSCLILFLLFILILKSKKYVV